MFFSKECFACNLRIHQASFLIVRLEFLNILQLFLAIHYIAKWKTTLTFMHPELFLANISLCTAVKIEVNTPVGNPVKQLVCSPRTDFFEPHEQTVIIANGFGYNNKSATTEISKTVYLTANRTKPVACPTIKIHNSVWNALPQGIKERMSVKLFNYKLHNYLMRNDVIICQHL